MPYTGISLSSGCASGIIFELTQVGKTLSDKFYLSVFEILEKFEAQKVSGLTKLKSLVEKAQNQTERELLEAYQFILEDDTLAEKIKEFIHLGHSLEDSIEKGVVYFQEMLAGLNNEYLALRGEDIRTVASYLLEEQENIFTQLEDRDYILVANDLSPKEIFEMPKSKIKGIILRQGQPFTHTAILLKSSSIPAIYQCDIPEGIGGMWAFIQQEKVFIQDKEPFDFETKEVLKSTSWLEKIKEQVLVTGVIHFPEDIDKLSKSGIKDIGLYRSEWLYMTKKEIPSYQYQLDRYQLMASKVKEGFLRIRTIDLGEDKMPSYLKDKEMFKSHRGSELYAYYPELIYPQLEALVEVSLMKPIRLLIPMVEDTKEVLDLSRTIRQIEKAKHIHKSQLSIGIMIESLKGYSHRKELIALADECMIGTSDFYSDCLGKPREDLKKQDFRTEAVEGYIKEVIEEAKARGKHIGLCGGLLDTGEGILRAINLGTQEVCISPYLTGD